MAGPHGQYCLPRCRELARNTCVALQIENDLAWVEVGKLIIGASVSHGVALISPSHPREPRHRPSSQKLRFGRHG